MSAMAMGIGSGGKNVCPCVSAGEQGNSLGRLNAQVALLHRSLEQGGFAVL